MERFAVPSRERFRAALEALTAQLPERHLRMLKEHYAAPRHTTTASRLAEAVGYRNYSGVNLQYGRLAAILGSTLEQSTGDFIGLKLLVEFVMPGEQDNDEILWVMRPELAGALEDLGWVSKGQEGA
jgi:5-methylcytosine-specific restriction enzyme A